ncbi:hypothetical protein PLICRDRAFT_396076 [Plicaturopsis crispa FD-325 SS-3]|nr:hypothetical protein PLICRDRAFT_396076 [Plicaturopsis crispa FD-325 SS-3]
MQECSCGSTCVFPIVCKTPQHVETVHGVTRLTARMHGREIPVQIAVSIFDNCGAPSASCGRVVRHRRSFGTASMIGPIPTRVRNFTVRMCRRRCTFRGPHDATVAQQNSR